MIAIAILNIAFFVRFNYIIHSDHRTGLEPVSTPHREFVTNYTNGGAGCLFILPAMLTFILA